MEFVFLVDDKRKEKRNTMDCAMCWNEWPTLTETPFPELAGIQVCRNCSRSMKQMVAFCRNHGLNVIPQVGTNSLDLGVGKPAKSSELEPAPMDEPPKSPNAKKPAK